MDAIFVVAASVSSIRFQVFSVEGDGKLQRQIRGKIDCIGSRPHLRAENAGGETLANRSYPAEVAPDVQAAFRIVIDWLLQELRVRLLAVGHRVGQGGPDCDRSVLIDDDAMVRLEQLVALAPLHQPHNLSPIRSSRADFPALPQVACFDTAFHQIGGASADIHDIPERFLPAGGHHGSHGLTYEYVARLLSQIAPDIAEGRTIVARLGRSSSMCALRGGRSVACTAGFGPDGGALCGLQPRSPTPPRRISEREMLASDVWDLPDLALAPGESSGVSAGMFETGVSDAPGASVAIEHFNYRISVNAGMVVAALQGLDAMVFTGETGEHSAAIRAGIADRMGWLGVVLDDAANRRHARLISRSESRVPVFVLPSDDELMIAQHTLALLLNGPF